MITATIMITLTVIAMADELPAKPPAGEPLTSDGLYRLMTWLSPAFPVGAFSYSHGLEAAIERGLVRNRESLERWIAGILEFGAGASDALLFRAAHAAITDKAIGAVIEL